MMVRRFVEVSLDDFDTEALVEELNLRGEEFELPVERAKKDLAERVERLERIIDEFDRFGDASEARRLISAELRIARRDLNNLEAPSWAKATAA